MLVLTRKTQQQIYIGQNITITIIQVKGQQVRVGIEAPRDVRVLRAEVPAHDDLSPNDPSATTAEGKVGERTNEKCDSLESRRRPGRPRKPRGPAKQMVRPLESKILARRAPCVDDAQLCTLKRLGPAPLSLALAAR